MILCQTCTLWKTYRCSWLQKRSPWKPSDSVRQLNSLKPGWQRPRHAQWAPNSVQALREHIEDLPMLSLPLSNESQLLCSKWSWHLWITKGCQSSLLRPVSFVWLVFSDGVKMLQQPDLRPPLSSKMGKIKLKQINGILWGAPRLKSTIYCASGYKSFSPFANSKRCARLKGECRSSIKVNSS